MTSWHELAPEGMGEPGRQREDQERVERDLDIHQADKEEAGRRY